MIHVFLCASEIEDPTAREISKNLFDNMAEFHYAASSSYMIDRITVGSSMDQLLEVARTSDSKWGAFFKIGCIFKFNYLNFIRDAVLDEDKDTVLIGHILDRGDRYYELHDQTFVLNLDKFKELPGYIQYTPEPGHKNLLDRSDDNFHHDYTPHWVEANGETQFYPFPAPGADLVSACAELGYVRPYNQKERTAKGFVYPETYEGFINVVGRLEKEIAHLKSRYFFMNTDQPGMIDHFRYMDSVSRMVVPASGFMPFEVLREMNPTDDFKFIFYDNSDVSRWMYEFMLDHWDGVDIHGFYHRVPRCLLAGIREDQLDDAWNGMMDRFGGQSEWLSFFNAYRKRRWMRNVDLFSSYDRHDFVSLYEGHAETTLYSVSNIYWYSPSSILRPYSYRMESFGRHMDYLRETAPGINVYWSVPGIETGCPVEDIKDYPVLSFPWRTGENLIDKTVELL